ncbi:MAG TPA: hypothetical protein ENN67_06380 [Firmicutes bacterium]|nr:hypothetical protein [Bacillota bacterium]
MNFEKDLSRCPGCGWDFRAHIIPENFLESPLDFAPLKEFASFLIRNAALVWINGLTVLAVWSATIYLIFRISSAILKIINPEWGGSPFGYYLIGISLVLGSILVMPIWSNYLFSLLRRYRYHVPVALFNVFVPGRSRYVQTIAWALPCSLGGFLLLSLLIVPGVVCLFIFVPFLLLIHLDKRSISDRRKTFIIELTFRKLWLLLILTGMILTFFWIVIAFVVGKYYVAGIIIAAMVIPAQAAFSVLLYESLLGRENLDVDG